MSTTSLEPKRDGVLRNVAWLTGANVLSRPAWYLFVTAACMRVLGLEGFGEMTSALALAGSVTALTEFGTNSYSIREIAKRPEQASTLFSNLIIGRLILISLGLIAIAGLGVWTKNSGPATSALVLGAVYALALRLIEYCRGIFQAFEVLRYEAATLLIEKLLVIGLGMAGLLLWRTPSGVLLGMASGVVATCGATLWLVHHRFAPFQSEQLSFRFFLSAYHQSLPIGVYSSATVLLLGSGALMLEAFSTDVSVGEWGATYRNLELFLLLPTLICTAALPRLAILHHRSDLREFKRLLGWSSAAILTGTVAVSIVVVLLADYLFLVLGGGEFNGAAPLLRIAIWAYPWMGITMLVTQVLVYVDDAYFAAGALVVATLLNGMYLFTAIPTLGPAAPAVSLIGAHVAISIACVWRLLHNLRGFPAAPILP